MPHGPGAHTADGCPVEVYARLRSAPAAASIHRAVVPGSAVLDLGCGTGRIAHALAELGHPVVAVDQSPEMLAHVRAARKVQSRIETLRLGEVFESVLLASHLVNVRDHRTRHAFLRTCAIHLAPGGCLFVQRFSPDFGLDGREAEQVVDGVRILVKEPRRHGERVLARVVYEADGEQWTHAVDMNVLDDEATDRELNRVGLVIDAWLDDQRTWLRARHAQA